MAQFPLLYEVDAEAGSGISNSWMTQGNAHAAISCSVPPEFGGPGGKYTPEDLFIMSCLNCMISTFKVYMEKFEMNFELLKAKGRMKMDIDPSSNLLFVCYMDFTFNITGASDPKVKEILEKAIEDCPISNSIKAGKTFHIEVV